MQGSILNPEALAPISRKLLRRRVLEGIRVTREYQITRWHDRSTHLWLGHKKAGWLVPRNLAC